MIHILNVVVSIFYVIFLAIRHVGSLLLVMVLYESLAKFIRYSVARFLIFCPRAILTPKWWHLDNYYPIWTCNLDK